MGDPSASPQVAQAPEMKNRNKNKLGGLMDPEAARMNRALLQEIARVKRGDEPSKILAAQT